MSKIITTYFVDDDGVPITGLSPKIRIRDLTDNSLVITDASMSETGDGGYKYTFADYDQSTPYQIRCYSGLTTGARYSFGFSMSSYYVGIAIISAYFLNDDGDPATGLHPTVRVRDLSDNSIVVNDLTMTEVGDGGYKYFFPAFNQTKNYQVRCDAGSTIEFRYSYGFNAEFQVEVMDLPLGAEIADELTLSGEVVNKIELDGEIERV